MNDPRIAALSEALRGHTHGCIPEVCAPLILAALDGWTLVPVGTAAADVRLRRIEEAARAVCRMDLRDDFPDGGDIILRWKGNRADWDALRAALEEKP